MSNSTYIDIQETKVEQSVQQIEIIIPYILFQLQGHIKTSRTSSNANPAVITYGMQWPLGGETFGGANGAGTYLIVLFENSFRIWRFWNTKSGMARV